MNHLIKWLLIPITASATLSPSPISHETSATMPILEASMAFDAPPMAYDALVAPSIIEATDTPSLSDKDLLQQYFGANWPIMYRIATCESRNRQFDANGETIQGPTDDWGYLQIHAPVWDATAKSLGLDYKRSLEDNIKMAKQVYDAQGTSAWVCARGII